MAGQVNLGNNRDVALGSIGNNLAHLLLGVVTGFWRVVVDGIIGVGEADVLPDDGAGTYAGLLSKFWQSLHLEAPALVFRQMPMETVDAVKGEDVNKLLDKGHREEMAGTVEHRAAIAEAWRTAHPGVGEANLSRLVHNAFAKRLDAIEHTALAGSLNHNAFLVNGDGIVIGIAALQTKCEGDVGTFFVCRCGEAKVFCGKFGIALHLCIVGGITNCHAFG